MVDQKMIVLNVSQNAERKVKVRKQNNCNKKNLQYDFETRNKNQY